MTQRIALQDANKGLLDGMMKTEFYLKKSGLDLKLQELVKYRVSQINHCAYCLDMHHKEAVHLGETEQRLYSLVAWRETPYYTDKERAVLALAEAVTHISQDGVSDEVYNNVAAFFTKAEIADLVVAIAQINAWNRLNVTFCTIPGGYEVGSI
ncbi:carboxymuconolactone decarboxylase family protein [Chitinophaga japonensis]|uniref:AhpD family alkylhydroperoxidase n=1 Tax=Chitinophaga japonensis TaxID=104662 RepID=A0A562TFP3_CHIJA|nr:carboxymuconolactone decarboxylase family protein [Chitinophaga japonensis]TWI92084.1 AhpD family alkylhydroperoxidase [Chitinophaga japonensis]